MDNLTVVSTLCLPCIVGKLSVVLILISKGKSNRCFNNFLALHFKAIYPLIQFFCQMENLTVVSTIFWHFLVGNLSVVSILFSSGKSNRCYNNFLAFPCRRFICRFNSFFKWKISPLFQQFVIFDCRKSIRCFNSFLKWIIKLFFQQLFCLAL